MYLMSKLLTKWQPITGEFFYFNVLWTRREKAEFLDIKIEKYYFVIGFALQYINYAEVRIYKRKQESKN